jgi:hypothetical protein
MGDEQRNDTSRAQGMEKEGEKSREMRTGDRSSHASHAVTWPFLTLDHDERPQSSSPVSPSASRFKCHSISYLAFPTPSFSLPLAKLHLLEGFQISSQTRLWMLAKLISGLPEAIIHALGLSILLSPLQGVKQVRIECSRPSRLTDALPVALTLQSSASVGGQSQGSLPYIRGWHPNSAVEALRRGEAQRSVGERTSLARVLIPRQDRMEIYRSYTGTPARPTSLARTFTR